MSYQPRRVCRRPRHHLYRRARRAVQHADARARVNPLASRPRGAGSATVRCAARSRSRRDDEFRMNANGYKVIPVGAGQGDFRKLTLPGDNGTTKIQNIRGSMFADHQTQTVRDGHASSAATRAARRSTSWNHRAPSPRSSCTAPITRRRLHAERGVKLTRRESSRNCCASAKQDPRAAAFFAHSSAFGTIAAACSIFASRPRIGRMTGIGLYSISVIAAAA